MPQNNVQEKEEGGKIKVIPMDNVIISADIERQPGRQATKNRLQESENLMKS